jgi:hypothetical protein
VVNQLVNCAVSGYLVIPLVGHLVSFSVSLLIISSFIQSLVSFVFQLVGYFVNYSVSLLFY